MCKAHKWKGQLQGTSILLFLGQDWQRRRKEGCFQVQLRPSRSQLISCSRQGLQHLLDAQSFHWLSRKTGCPESLLCSLLAPSSLACPHTAQTKNQWPYKSHPRLQWWDVPKRLSSAVPGKQRESWGCHGCCIQPPEWLPQVHLYWAVDLCSPPQYSWSLTHTRRSGSHQCPRPHTALNCYPDLLNILATLFLTLFLTWFFTNSTEMYRRSQTMHWLWCRISPGNPSTKAYWCCTESVPGTFRVRPVPAFRQELDSQSMNLYRQWKGKTLK